MNIDLDASMVAGLVEDAEEDRRLLAEWDGVPWTKYRDLANAAFWFRAMVRKGGPDGSSLAKALVHDLDEALGDYEPR